VCRRERRPRSMLVASRRMSTGYRSRGFCRNQRQARPAVEAASSAAAISFEHQRGALRAIFAGDRSPVLGASPSSGRRIHVLPQSIWRARLRGRAVRRRSRVRKVRVFDLGATLRRRARNRVRPAPRSTLAAPSPKRRGSPRISKGALPPEGRARRRSLDRRGNTRTVPHDHFAALHTLRSLALQWP
jgi:hypothetical protein